LVFGVIDNAKAEFAELEVREWNLAEHPELGPRYGVTAAPAIVINGRLEFRRIPDDQTFRARLAAIVKTHGD
jgi:protein-disulfide isomerase